MKKLFSVITCSVVLFALMIPSIAATGIPTETPADFITWAALKTPAGAAMVTMLLVQLFKKYFPESMDTRLITYIFGAVCLVLATVAVSFMEGPALNVFDIVLCFVNALFLTGGTNLVYDVATGRKAVKQ